MTSDRIKQRGVGLVGTGVVLVALAANAMPLAKESQDSLAARLQKMEDRQAIEQLIMGDYPRALDSSNWKAYASLFAADGELVMNTTSVKGPAEIEAYFNRPRAPQGGNAPTAPRVLKHIVSNLTLQLNGDRATAQAYWQTIASSNGSTVIAGAGHYEDTLKRENGVWKFTRRAIISEPPPAPAATAAR